MKLLLAEEEIIISESDKEEIIKDIDKEIEENLVDIELYAPYQTYPYILKKYENDPKWKNLFEQYNNIIKKSGFSWIPYF